MITAIRTIEAALGEPDKRPTTAELEMASIARKSLHWRRALSPGQSVGSGRLDRAPPGTGIPPSRLDELLGRPVLVATVPGSLVTPEDVAPAAAERPAVMRIAVLTTGRQDWGILRSTCLLLRDDDRFDLRLLVGGMHCSPAFGQTERAHRRRRVCRRRAARLDHGRRRACRTRRVARSPSVAGALERQEPDALLLVGDRFETAAAAIAATLRRVPIVHLHGGEETAGAIDDALPPRGDQAEPPSPGQPRGPRARASQPSAKPRRRSTSSARRGWTTSPRGPSGPRGP